MKKIWVSYSHKDVGHLQRLQPIIEYLSGLQLSVLSDCQRLGPGNYNEEIAERIYSSDILVLLISKNFINSNYCKLEVAYMNSPEILSQKKIYPITLDGLDLKAIEGKGSLNLKNIINIRTCYELSNTSAHSGGKKCTWRDFSLEIIRDLHVVPVENVSLLDFIEPIVAGKFVPFIGPECCSLEEEWIPLLPKLEERLQRVEERLNTDDHNLQFARAVAESRVPGINRIDHSSSLKESSRKQGLHSPKSPSSFTDLRVAIVKSGAAASRILGTSLSDCKGLIDTRYFSVRTSTTNNPDAQILRDALEEAKTIAGRFPIDEDCLNGSKFQRLCLGASKIAEKLDKLKESIFSPDKTNENSANSVTESFLVLTLSQLDWLGDLFWHTMRYDLPILPRSDELAFQLSVCQASDCLVRIPLGTAGVIFAKSDRNTEEINKNAGHKNCTYLIYHHLDKNRARRPSKKSSEFYNAIAKLLWQPCSRKPCTYQDPPLGMPSGKSVGKLFRPPIAISVNLDTELEYCLQETEYSIITPIQTVEKKIPAWLLRINKPNDKDDDFYMVGDSVGFDTHIQYIVKGPLILKLRGSTLHKIPPDSRAPVTWVGEKKSGINNGIEIENRLLLSTLEFARFTKVEPLDFVTDILVSSQVLCFFGYPLDDPDGLLGIQRGVWMAESNNPDNTTDKLEKSKRISIGCGRQDGFGNEFLRELNIQPLDMDLNDVAKEINSIPELRELPAKRIES